MTRLIERLVAATPPRWRAALRWSSGGGLGAARCVGVSSPLTGRATVVGFTGPPGVGKSTLIDAYIAKLRASGRSVAVAAVDPSSPLSGGAVLGDRIRMHRHTGDPGVFIRSIASRGHLGGLSENIHWTVDAMDASGRDVVIIETVGTGQSEVEVVGDRGRLRRRQRARTSATTFRRSRRVFWKSPIFWSSTRPTCH